jgi:hypothetical protein
MTWFKTKPQVISPTLTIDYQGLKIEISYASLAKLEDSDEIVVLLEGKPIKLSVYRQDSQFYFNFETGSIQYEAIQ